MRYYRENPGSDHDMSPPKISVVITDLDNTLFDWFEVWHRSFSAMLDNIVKKSGVPRERLLGEIKEVHRRHGTSEYAFLIEELPSLKEKHPGAKIVELYDDAIQAYREARRSSLRCYPSVKSTLYTLKSRGVYIVAYTESMAFYTRYRFLKLELDGLIDVLYSPRDHDLPAGLTPEQIRMYPPEHYQFGKTVHRFTPSNELKPNAKLLLDIIKDVGAELNQVIYVGDNLSKDVAMAQEAGVIDVHANYGTSHTRDEYQLLVAVTHWSDADVKRERELKKHEINPTLSLNRNFGEILDWFEFVPFARGETVAARKDSTDNLLMSGPLWWTFKSTLTTWSCEYAIFRSSL
jgi:phosphoglycolate phosphatase-like HAD superfamily hydrolase